MKWTVEAEARLREYLDRPGRLIPIGLGHEDEACSLAAINLALTGDLTDRIPECMSEVIGHWIIYTQDEMPGEIRNSAEWKSLLPLAAGTGRQHEHERLDVILDWMWGDLLPMFEDAARVGNFGGAWADMLTARTAEAARAAWRAGRDGCPSVDVGRVDRAKLRAAGVAVTTADRVANMLNAIEQPLPEVAVMTADRVAMRDALWPTVCGVQVVSTDAVLVADDARALRAFMRVGALAKDQKTPEMWTEMEHERERGETASEEAWRRMNPCGVLRRLIEVTASDAGAGWRPEGRRETWQKPSTH